MDKKGLNTAKKWLKLGVKFWAQIYISVKNWHFATLKITHNHDPGSKVGGEEIRGGFEKSKNSDSEKSPGFNFQGDPQPWDGCLCFLLSDNCGEAPQKIEKNERSLFWIWSMRREKANVTFFLKFLRNS